MLRYASGLADLTSIRRRRRPWRRTTAPTFAVHCEYPPPPSSCNRKPLSQDEQSAGSFGPSVSEEADDRFGRRRRRPWRRTTAPTFAVHCEYPPPPSSCNRKPLSQDEQSAGSFGPSVSEEADDRFGRRRRRPWRRTIIPTPPKATDSAPFSFLFFSIASYEFNNQDSLFS
jgi:hypothetical protein